MLKRATFSQPVSARAFADQTGSTYQRAPTNGLFSGCASTELNELDELERLRELLDKLIALDVLRELLERLDELLLQIPGNEAQYASLHVSGGQSGQLLPCGQLNPDDLLLDDLLMDDWLAAITELEETLEELLLVSIGQSGQLLPGGQLNMLLLNALEDTRLIELLLSGVLEFALLHTAPVTVGRCAGTLATPLLPCTPNSMVCPGLIRSFQPTPVAVKGLLPEMLAFQPPVRVVPSV